MAKKRDRRFTKIARALVYLRDFGRGYAKVYDPESLREACFIVSNYIEILELSAKTNDRQSATRKAESLAIQEAAQRKAASQIDLFEPERTGLEHEHEHESPT